MKSQKGTYRLGDLIAALHEEAGRLTKNKRLQSQLACLALMDLQRKIRLTRSSFRTAA